MSKIHDEKVDMQLHCSLQVPVDVENHIEVVQSLEEDKIESCVLLQEMEEQESLSLYFP
jgi:hypothetical protein